MLRAIVVLALLACAFAAPAVEVPKSAIVSVSAPGFGPVTQTNTYAIYNVNGFGTLTKPAANTATRVTVTFQATVTSGQDVCFTAFLPYGNNLSDKFYTGPNKFCTTTNSKTVIAVAETQYLTNDQLDIVPYLTAELQGTPVSASIQATVSMSSVTEDVVDALNTFTSNDYGTPVTYSNGSPSFRRAILFPYISWPTTSITTGATATVTAKATVAVPAAADFTLCFSGGFAPIKNDLFRTNANYNTCANQGTTLAATTVTWSQTFTTLPPATPYLFVSGPASTKRNAEAAVSFGVTPTAPATTVTSGPTAASGGCVSLNFAFANMFVVPKVGQFP